MALRTASETTKSGPAERARKCFALASHPATPPGEAAAALERGLALLITHDLDPDRFDIPGRDRGHTKRPDPALERPCYYCGATVRGGARVCDDCLGSRYKASAAGSFADIFGRCIGCGAVSSVGAYCRSCGAKAELQTCRHGQHGYCLECEGGTL